MELFPERQAFQLLAKDKNFAELHEAERNAFTWASEIARRMREAARQRLSESTPQN